MLWTLKDVRCFLWIESEAQKGLLNAHTSMVMSSTIISNSAFHCHNQTSLTTLAHKLHLFSACNCTLLVLGYHLHLPLHGTFLLPQNFVECPVGKSVLQLVSSKGSHEHGVESQWENQWIRSAFFLGSEVCSWGWTKGQTERMAVFYSLRLMFEKTHCILNNKFII